MGVKILHHEGSLKDKAGRQALNTIFGERIVANRVASIAKQFFYGINTNNAVIEELNGGTITTESGLLTGQTGVNANGSAAIETKEYIRYKPAFDTWVNFTALFGEPKENSSQLIGGFDDNDGIMIGYQGLDLVLIRRRAGVDHVYNLDVEKLNFDIDMKNGNLFRINYGYQGFSNIILEVKNPKGSWETWYDIEYPNQHQETNLSNTYLPLKGEVKNYGNTTNIKLQSGSIAAGVLDGQEKDLMREYGQIDNGVTTIAAGENHIVTIRSKDNFYSKANRIAAKLEEVIVATDINKTGSLIIEKNATITGATWIDKDADNSIIEYSPDATVTTGTGHVVFSLPLEKVGVSSKVLEDKGLRIYPLETFSFYITTTGTGEVTSSQSWFELF